MTELLELGRCLSLQVVLRKIDEIYERHFRPDVIYHASASGKDSRANSKNLNGYSECEDIDVENIVKRVLSAGLQSHALNDLYGYLNKTIRNQIVEVLRRRGIAFRKGKCGTCRYLSESRPKICQLEGSISNESSSEIPNRFFGKERKWDDPSCIGHLHRTVSFKPIEGHKDQADTGFGSVLSEQARSDGSWRGETEAKLDMAHLFGMLQDCYEGAETAKQKEIYALILEDLTYIYEKLKGGWSFEESRSSLLDLKTSSQEKRDNYAKKLRRNLHRVEECLGPKKMSE